MNMQWTREIVIERWIKPITPLSWSYMQESLLKGFKKSMLKLGLDIGEEIPLFNLFYGRVYINQSLINDAMKDFPLDSPIPTQDKEEVKQNSMMKAVIKNPGMIIILMKMLKFLNSVHKEWGVLLSTFTDEFTSKKPVEYNKLKVNELLAELNWNTDVVAKLFDNHADSILAADSTIKILESFLKGGSKPLDKSLIPKLLSGLTGNITVKTNHELWKISNIIRNDKKLYEVISKCKGSKDWFDEVKQKTNNEEFVKIVNNYYEQYGHRLTCYDMVEKPIREQPQVILEMLQMYMSNNVSDPLESEKLKANERELLTKEIISSLPILKRGAFKQILKLTQTYFRLRENQQFYLMKNVPNLRNIVIELGKIFKEKGILKNVDDIFYLEIKEIRAIASKLSNSATNSSEVPDNPLDLVKSRQEYNQRYANYNPPIVLGIKESEVNLSTNSKLIGIAASSGIVKGKACVILSNKDFNKLKKGEILVTIATTPTWTPLFGIAGGIITEFGALLSHSAVVAREYGLPAVLGVQNATKLIKDGDEIIIDGTEGVVYIK
jgi:pyruvate,water dikinase